VQKLLLFLVLATVLYLLARFARRQVGRQIEVVNRRSSRNH
jgi:membrane protein implicated in regulation of membrane protease activity